jgi:hypothetical protein
VSSTGTGTEVPGPKLEASFFDFGAMAALFYSDNDKGGGAYGSGDVGDYDDMDKHPAAAKAKPKAFEALREMFPELVRAKKGEYLSS